MKTDAVIAGDALFDYQYWVKRIPGRGEDETILSQAENSGGAGLNTAFALASLGIKVTMLASIGTDGAGGELFRRMEKAGIDTSLVRRKGVTGYTIAIVDEEAERTMLSCRGASADVLQMTDAVRDTIRAARLLFISGYLLLDGGQAAFALACAKCAKSSGTIVMMDATPVIARADPLLVQTLLKTTDIFLPNKRELELVSGFQDTEKALSHIAETVPCIALKLGAAGSIMRMAKGFPLADGSRASRSVYSRAAAQRIAAVDTTGAGDAFNAGIAAAYLAGDYPENWLAKANALAARVVSQKGAAL
jgi:sugar/nucleoside kinase (ribokinase family)